ncbi:MAG TPA: type 4a pilus biogenesis protein PilO [Fimbriimonadaceae bacterium]|nr:type 4a pilus biogenesis protein PilO [Fimbriimonadaceae bacterium]
MKKMPNPKLFLILAVLFLFIGGAASYFQYGTMSELADKVSVLKKEAKDENALKAQLAEENIKLQETSAKLNHLEQGVPELAYVPTMLKELEAVGKENGLEILGVRPMPKQAQPAAKDKEGSEKKTRQPYTELDIEVRGRGSYRSVMNFVNALQTFPKIVAARTVSLSPKQDFATNPGAPKLEVTVELRSFLFPTKDKKSPKSGVTAQKMEDDGRDG